MDGDIPMGYYQFKEDDNCVSTCDLCHTYFMLKPRTNLIYGNTPCPQTVKCSPSDIKSGLCPKCEEKDCFESLYFNDGEVLLFLVETWNPLIFKESNDKSMVVQSGSIRLNPWTGGVTSLPMGYSSLRIPTPCYCYLEGGLERILKCENCSLTEEEIDAHFSQTNCPSHYDGSPCIVCDECRDYMIGEEGYCELGRSYEEEFGDTLSEQKYVRWKKREDIVSRCEEETGWNSWLFYKLSSARDTEERAAERRLKEEMEQANRTNEEEDQEASSKETMDGKEDDKATQLP